MTFSQEREMVLEAFVPTFAITSGCSMRETIQRAYSSFPAGERKPSTPSCTAEAAVEPASMREGVCIAAASRTTRPQVS